MAAPSPRMDETDGDILAGGRDLLADVGLLTDFSQVADPERYRPVPDGWWVGIADVVGSTEAVTSGGYKAVNMAGAAVIVALSNAVGRARFPFVFGGDGAGFAVPDGWADTARRALGETARLVEEEFGLRLRVALVPVAAIRQAGLDLRVARVALSPALDHVMFSGGGLSWAEDATKAGRFAVPPAPPGARPDLTGLSCRFAQSKAQRGIILSVLVRPTGDAPDAYRALIGQILADVEDSPGGGRPVPEHGPPLRWPPPALALETAATRPAGASRVLHGLRVWLRNAFGYGVLRFRIPLGRFDPLAYLRQLVAHSDYRKYDDGLRMTIDCAPELADRIELALQEAEGDGIVRFGLHRQDAALMTCFTASVFTGDHIHFIDGADGGYAQAAARLKESAEPA